MNDDEMLYLLPASGTQSNIIFLLFPEHLHSFKDTQTHTTVQQTDSSPPPKKSSFIFFIDSSELLFALRSRYTLTLQVRLISLGHWTSKNNHFIFSVRIRYACIRMSKWLYLDRIFLWAGENFFFFWIPDVVLIRILSQAQKKEWRGDGRRKDSNINCSWVSNSGSFVGNIFPDFALTLAKGNSSKLKSVAFAQS